MYADPLATCQRLGAEVIRTLSPGHTWRRLRFLPTSDVHSAVGPNSSVLGHLHLCLHRELQRYVKTDVGGYILVFPTMLVVYFALNRPIYARWGTLFLQKLKSADPKLRELLEKGGFASRRTRKGYSRSAVDLSLEQTVILHPEWTESLHSEILRTQCAGGHWLCPSGLWQSPS